ncbi:hypothetical protein TVAG_600900 [Trichomonas vaginalis G3]|uniref:Uncharacterized protein n=2 Tax=Trichomonas vaginalis (strain ATCC PRA-98 / G3) TaxID=412133 RepID=A2GQV1_TRIV3|nr:hypothetical protein TVAG_600900 [Trichomonas vaginalis G3]|eukprot:XP_001293397.1 hypothetical protein [Trichomonas vaginalis G3]
MYRQIPLSVAFSSENPDVKIKGNRVTFKFPTDWIVNINEEKYIGITSMYITRAFRKVDFILQVEIENDEQSLSAQNIHIYKYFKDDTTLLQCMISFNEMFEKKFNIEAQTLQPLREFLAQLKEEGSQPQLIDFHYEFNENEDGTHDCQFVVFSPFNEVAKEKENPLRIRFQISEPSDDFKNVFNYDAMLPRKNEFSKIVTPGIWDRKQAILYSNLSKGVENEFIGHTRTTPLPNPKYYKLTGFNREFWIDMFSTHDHNCSVFLPPDHKDCLYIEAQLLNSTIAVL